MHMENRKRIYRRRRMAEGMQVICAVLIVIVAALAFLYQEDYAWSFPVVFGLAAGMNIWLGVRRLRSGRGEKKLWARAWMHFIFGGIMALTFMISLVMLWR